MCGVQKHLLGRKLKLYTDFIDYFHPQKGIPEIATTWLQWWAVIPSAYKYEVLFQPFVNYGNKNALSRLPLDQDQHCVDEVEEIICAVETQQLDELPGTD